MYRMLSPPKGDWVAVVESHAYEAVYTHSEKNYADFCQHFSWGVIGLIRQFGLDVTLSLGRQLGQKSGKIRLCSHCTA